jgi:FlaG/FlaF family flagellin (archaellin)
VVGVAEQTQDPAPNIAQSSANITGGSNSTAQLVRIRHLAGDNVEVNNLDIVVRAPACDPSKARLTNFPVEGNRGFNDENIRYGAALIDESNPDNSVIGGVWEFGVIDDDTPNTFKAGTFFEFRINSGDCRDGNGFRPGDRVTIDVIHAPTQSIIISENLRVSGN